MIAVSFLLSIAAPAASDPVAATVIADLNSFCVPFMRTETLEATRSFMLSKGLTRGAANMFHHGEISVDVSESRDGLRICSVGTKQATFEAMASAIQRWPNIYGLTQTDKRLGFARWEGPRYFLSLTQIEDGTVSVKLTRRRG